MKKTNFISLILGTISAVMFALGMCMALITEWNDFRNGVVLGSAGLAMGLVTVIIRRKMEHKPPIRLNLKSVLTVALGIIGALGLGVGMCFSMVWGKMAFGIVIGLIGITMLLCLVPLTKGLK